MPIKKETSARLVKFGYNFTVIPQQVAQEIKDPMALAYWTYLLTLPDDWVVRREHLLEHFGIGRKSHDRAMKYLKEAGLVWIQAERDGKGRIVDRKIMIGAIPVDDLPSPKVTLSTSRTNPQVGQRDHIQIEPVITKRTSNTTTRPTVEEVAEYVKTRPIQIDPQSFVDYYTANGWKVGRNPMKDWKAAVRTWEKKEKQNGQNRQESGHQDTRKLSAVERVREARRRAEQAEHGSPDLGTVVGTQ